MLTNKMKLQFAQQLLLQITKDWNENEVKSYNASLSFDELVREINSIELK